MDQAFPCRRRATRQLTYRHPFWGGFGNPQTTLRRGLSKFPTKSPVLPPMIPLATPIYYPPTLSNRWRSSEALRARHFSRDAQMAFCNFSPEPYQIPLTHRASPFSNRPNSLRSSIHRASIQPFGRIDAHSAFYLHSYCCFDSLSGPVNPPYMRNTLLGCTALMTKPPNPSECQRALGVTPRTADYSLPSRFAWIPARCKS
jgi:hypothetical protein